MHNYLCWVLQLMYLLLMPRIIPSIGAVLLVATFHFSLNSALDGLYLVILLGIFHFFWGNRSYGTARIYISGKFFGPPNQYGKNEDFTGMVENPLRR